MSTIVVSSRLDRSGLRQAVSAETIKITTLRSARWTVLVTLAGSIAITVLSTNSVAHHGRPWYQGFDPTNQSLGGLVLAALSVGVLGALTMTSEYWSGTVHPSLAAVPRRRTLIAAKILVLGGLALALGEALSWSCFGIGQAVLGAGGAPTAALSQPDVVRAVALSGFGLSLMALLGLGLGMLLRHTVAALAGYGLVSFLLPLALQRIRAQPSRFTPVTIVANTLSATLSHPGQVAVGLGTALMVLYAVVALGAGAAGLLRRDA